MDNIVISVRDLARTYNVHGKKVELLPSIGASTLLVVLLIRHF